MKTPTNVYATAHAVGDWNGDEQLAADNLNRIYDAIYGSVDEDYDLDKLSQIIHDVWGDWGSDELLLELTDSEIEGYVDAIL